MKNFLYAMGMLFVMNAHADIEYMPTEQSAKATPTEIGQNRACFEELKVQGCGDPGEDPQHFRSCLKNVYPTLTSNCKSMMSELYEVK